MTDHKEGTVKSSKLHLVDLGGSESAGKTNGNEERLKEAKALNQSLVTLGRVIKSLTDEKITHIPYRESKLTRILMQSLGGNSNTSIIVNVTPF